MSAHITEQEAFWEGEFGTEYTTRNVGEKWLASNTALFARILGRTGGVKSVLEFGANRGLNLRAISSLMPNAEFGAIEINSTAVEELRSWGGVKEIHHQSILDFTPTRTWDLVFIKGVLIHIAPEHLREVYERLYQAADRYVCLIEYYNPKPVEVNYRGHAGKLFKRDFAGELLDAFPELRLVDYGFIYHRDPNFPQDDCTWFLLEKTDVQRLA